MAVGGLIRGRTAGHPPGRCHRHRRRDIQFFKLRTCCPCPRLPGSPVPSGHTRPKGRQRFAPFGGSSPSRSNLLQAKADPPVVAAEVRSGLQPRQWHKGRHGTGSSARWRVVPVTHQHGGGGLPFQHRDLRRHTLRWSQLVSPAQRHQDGSRPDGAVEDLHQPRPLQTSKALGLRSQAPPGRQYRLPPAGVAGRNLAPEL